MIKLRKYIANSFILACGLYALGFRPSLAAPPGEVGAPARSLRLDLSTLADQRTLDHNFAAACASGDIAQMTSLLAQGAQPGHLADLDNLTSDPIYISSLNRHPEAIQLLLRHGVSGAAALRAATLTRNWELLNQLLIENRPEILAHDLTSVILICAREHRTDELSHLLFALSIKCSPEELQQESGRILRQATLQPRAALFVLIKQLIELNWTIPFADRCFILGILIFSPPFADAPATQSTSSSGYSEGIQLTEHMDAISRLLGTISVTTDPLLPPFLHNGRSYPLGEALIHVLERAAFRHNEEGFCAYAMLLDQVLRADYFRYIKSKDSTLVIQILNSYLRFNAPTLSLPGSPPLLTSPALNQIQQLVKINDLYERTIRCLIDHDINPFLVDKHQSTINMVRQYVYPEALAQFETNSKIRSVLKPTCLILAIMSGSPRILHTVASSRRTWNCSLFIRNALIFAGADFRYRWAIPILQEAEIRRYQSLVNAYAARIGEGNEFRTDLYDQECRRAASNLDDQALNILEAYRRHHQQSVLVRATDADRDAPAPSASSAISESISSLVER